MNKLNHLDLFSGIGGFSLGLEATGYFETVAFCDFDPYCQKVLRKHWPWVTIYDDVKELNSERLSANGHTKIDIITGGYPCQPFSIAGRQKGEQDPRHVWPEMFRLVKELRPTWVIGENVSGHIKLGLDTVLENLESEGYSARAFSISASSIGANHQRERVWIIANSNDTGDRTSQSSINQDRQETDQGWEGLTQFELSGHSKDMENTRRTQWPWSFFGDQDENETGEGHANQFERSSQTSKSDVANTESVSSYGRENREHTEQRDTERQTGREGSHVANTTTHRSFDESKRNIRNMGEKSEAKERAGNKFTVRSEARSSKVSNTDSERLEGRWSQCELRESQEEGQIGWSQWWQSEPNVGRVAHGVSKRVDRLKCLGNSLVPMIPYYIGMSIKKGDMLWTKK